MTYSSLAGYISTTNNKPKELRMFDLKLANQLTTTSEITKLAPSPKPSKNLQGNKNICLVGIRPTEKF